MKVIPDSDVFIIITKAEDCGYVVTYDGFGELIIRTGIFKWDDHHYRDISEDEYCLTKKLYGSSKIPDLDIDEYDDENLRSHDVEIE
jgi:hypothetical protein